MFSKACSLDGKTVFYLDSADNKYVATGGSLAWRLNNPGLVHSTSRFFARPGSIGHFGHYAIFSSPEKGREALSNWLHTKKFFTGSLKTIAKHYQPEHPETFSNRLSSLTSIPIETRVRTLNEQDFNSLLCGIEKLCGYGLEGNETFHLLPKILGKIEWDQQEDFYWIGGNIVLPRKEAVKWAETHRLDTTIVHGFGGHLYLRSRCGSRIQYMHFPVAKLLITQDELPLARVVGAKKPGQCIWAFINGIDNTKADSIEAASKISSMVNGEQVLSFQNDTKGMWGLIDFCNCILLKTSLNLPVIERTVNFLRYLLALAKEESAPVIIFAHSQGAILLEHALEFLSSSEANMLRIFTFGGGSFIKPEKCHPDSHNFASAADFVCLAASPNLQILALERYHAHKKGLTDMQMVHSLATKDAILELSPAEYKHVDQFVQQRAQFYQNALTHIRNLTILDPDPDSRLKHKFASDCYQSVVQQLIYKYRNQL